MIARADNGVFHYGYFDDLRSSLTLESLSSPEPPIHHVERRNGSSVIRVQIEEKLGTGELSRTTHRLMHVVAMIPMSDGFSADLYALDHVKSVLLAQHHFNNRIESVVPDLRKLLANEEDGSDCDLRMSLDFVDTRYNPRIAVATLVEVVHPQQFPYETTATVGALRSAVSIPTAALNGVQQIPQISYASTSTALDQRGPYSSFGRVVPSSTGDATAALEYFIHIAKSTHFGIMYVDDEYGSSYRLELQHAALKQGVATEAFAISGAQTLTDDAKKSIVKAARVLAETGYCHFVAVIQFHALEYLLEIGVDQGIMGPGKLWLFGDAIYAGDVDLLKFPSGSPQALALHGSGILAIGASRVDGSYHRFLQAIREQEQDSQFFDYFTTISPLGTNALLYNSSFRTEIPTDFSELSYDSVMSLAIAGCRSKNTFFSGKELLQGFTKSNFTAASGHLLIDESTRGRLHNTVTYVIHNIQIEQEEQGMVGAKIVLASEYVHDGRVNADGQVVAGWVSPPGIMYNYSDYTTKPPLPLPPLEVQNILDQTYLWICNLLACLVMLSATGFAIWTLCHRNSYVIRASQPSFLLVICLGEFLMALSIVMLGVTSPPYNAAWASLSCMPPIWSFSFGFSLVFSALFAKTWRVNKVLGSATRFQRVTVTLKDAALPGCIMVLGGLLVTAAWQVIDPRIYRLEFDVYGGSVDRFGRPLEVVSTCSYEHRYGQWFASALVLIMGTTVIAANFQAYQARHYATEFSESVYIGWSMAISLQGIILSIPAIFFELDTNSSYLAQAAVLLLLSSSTLLLIFIPKVFHHVHYEKQQRAKSERMAERKKARLPTQDPNANNCSDCNRAAKNQNITFGAFAHTQDGAESNRIRGSLLIAPTQMHIPIVLSGRYTSLTSCHVVNDKSDRSSLHDDDAESNVGDSCLVNNGTHTNTCCKQSKECTASVKPNDCDSQENPEADLWEKVWIQVDDMIPDNAKDHESLHQNQMCKMEQEVPPSTITGQSDETSSEETITFLAQSLKQVPSNTVLGEKLHKEGGLDAIVPLR